MSRYPDLETDSFLIQTLRRLIGRLEVDDDQAVEMQRVAPILDVLEFRADDRELAHVRTRTPQNRKVTGNERPCKNRT